MASLVLEMCSYTNYQIIAAECKPIVRSAPRTAGYLHEMIGLSGRQEIPLHLAVDCGEESGPKQT